MRTCDDCVYMKTYRNYRKMAEQKSEKVIWLNQCQNTQVKPSEIKNLNVASSCAYYDEDTWVK